MEKKNLMGINSVMGVMIPMEMNSIVDIDGVMILMEKKMWWASMALNGHHDAGGEIKHAGHQWCYVCDDADGEDKHYECHDPSGEFNLTIFLEY